MAIDYFDTFPKVQYDMGKDNKTREITNLLKRVGIRGDFKNLFPSYYKSVLSASQRPEISAHGVYGDIFSHWILLHMNTVTDPYHDWIMEEKVLNEFIDLKYPDRSLLLESTHHTMTKHTAGIQFPNDYSASGYIMNNAGGTDVLVIGETYTFYTVGGSDDFTNVGAGASPSIGDTFVATGTTPTTWGAGTGSIILHSFDVDGKRFFVKGETIREYQTSSNVGATGATGTIIDFDATLIQLTYTVDTGTFASANYIKGDDSGAVGKIATSGVTTERTGVHHYESEDGIIVGRSHSGASAITNETFENNENEKKREIMMLEGRYVQQFEQNFEEIMNA